MTKPWHLLAFGAAILGAFLTAGHFTTPSKTAETYIDPPHPAKAMVTNVFASPPMPGAKAMMITSIVPRTVAMPQIIQPPSVHTNKISIVEYIPANTGNDTNRRWTALQVSHQKGHWSAVASNEQINGYLITNNITDTNPAAQFRTVSQ